MNINIKKYVLSKIFPGGIKSVIYLNDLIIALSTFTQTNFELVENKNKLESINA